jgi:ubiquinone/menaquinone biosynthesis C-methylase UbiE
MSQLGEKILVRFSRPPTVAEPHVAGAGNTVGLQLLKRAYPEFESLIKGKSIVDFGCGMGTQSLALAEAGAARVLGLDTNLKSLNVARESLAQTNHASVVEFTDVPRPEHLAKFDIVISQNSMEHFPQPEPTLQEMARLIGPQGKLLITFGPPWYAPYGSHMRFFTSIPWVNILFSERTVMTVRGRYRKDGALRYEECESGLNKMSIRKFEGIVASMGFMRTYSHYDGVKGLDFLTRVPIVRELFVNHVTVILEKKRSAE